MQEKARDDLARLFAAELDKAGLRAELERIVAVPGLSKDMFEQASKSLDG